MWKSFTDRSSRLTDLFFLQCHRRNVGKIVYEGSNLLLWPLKPKLETHCQDFPGQWMHHSGQLLLVLRPSHVWAHMLRPVFAQPINHLAHNSLHQGGGRILFIFILFTLRFISQASHLIVGGGWGHYVQKKAADKLLIWLFLLLLYDSPWLGNMVS